MADKNSEQDEKEAIKQAFGELARKWEESDFMTTENPQLSHIRNIPEVKKMVKMGMEVLPLVYEKLKENILYCIIFEGILDGEEIEVKIDQRILDGEGKWGHLEPKRQAYLKWWKDQQKTD